MNHVPSLYQELIDEKNRYLSDEDSFQLVSIFTNLLFAVFIVSLIIGAFLIVIESFTIYNIPFNLNDYMSVCFGNTAFYFSFKLIKHKVIPYYMNNPIILIGIIYPAFFNASLLQVLVSFNPIFKIAFLILNAFIYYFILNKYYQAKYYKNNR